MKIRITFFGQTADIVNSATLETEIGTAMLTSELICYLEEKFPSLRTIELKLAVNNKLIINDLNLNDGDEISVLPPFSGG